MEADSPSEAGYSWISEELGLSLLEEVRIAGQVTTWRVTGLKQEEPRQDVLRVPPDFTEARSGGNN